VVGTFKANNPVNNFLLLLYGIALKLPLFLHPQIPQPQQVDGFLYRFLLNWLKLFGTTAPIIYSLLVFILIFTQAVSLNKLSNDLRLFPKPAYLIGMSYLLVTSIFPDWQILSAPLIINSLVIWIWAKMSSLYNTQNVKTILFNMGLVVGISTFFYFPSIAFAALIIFGLAITRPFKLGEWLLALFGIITPYYFLLAIIFLTDKWKGYKLPGFSINNPLFKQSQWSYVAIVFLIALAAVGFFYVQQNFRRQLIQARKSWSLLFLYLIIAIFVPFINASQTFNYWILCAVPFAILQAATFFYLPKRWLSLLLHWGLVALVILFEYVLR
jgi:hypothetical protein